MGESGLNMNYEFNVLGAATNELNPKYWTFYREF